jgi:hypothetical protein
VVTPKPASDAGASARATLLAERTEAELAKTRMALEIMGKAHALLEMLAESADCDPKPKSDRDDHDRAGRGPPGVPADRPVPGVALPRRPGSAVRSASVTVLTGEQVD